MLTPESATAKDIRTGLAPMQHRHFATVATIIRERLGALSKKDRDYVANVFSIALQETNPKFDKARFRAACQPSKGAGL